MYERNRTFVCQFLMELYGFPISSERRTSAALFSRRLHKLGERFLVRVLGQSDRTITTIWNNGENRPYPRVEKIALVKLDPEQKDLIRACEEGGFFVDAEKRVVIIRISYKQHRYNADNVRQDRALSVERQELIHPLTGRVLPDVNVVKDTSTMILRLNDIVRGEYVGRAVYKRNELVENTDTDEKRLKFLFAWLSKSQRRIIGYSEEFYNNTTTGLDAYLKNPENQEAFALLHDLKQEVMSKYAGDLPHDIPQTAYLISQKEVAALPENPNGQGDLTLYSHEECLKDKKKQAQNFRHIEEESNRYAAARILQQVGKQTVVTNPPYPPMTQGELDMSFDLPYTRLPHPKYKNKRIPAYEMIKFSVNIHRGCFGGCAFCTISAHQGKFIVSRSKESILKEVKAIAEMPDFKGYLSDLGGPSANMYQMGGKDTALCRRCKRPSCIHPKVCPNLNTDHQPLLEIYHAVDSLPGIKKSFIGSGVRYDLLLHQSKDAKTNQSTKEYTRELITRHVSGRLKVAPEHTSDKVLYLMRKPPFEQFYEFKRIFDKINKEAGLRQQIIPYFISSHPGCTEEDMAELAVITKKLDFHLEQVQDFTPTPMTVSTEAWYTGVHPYTLEPVFSAKTPREKLAQRMFFFWYKPEERKAIINELRKIGRNDLINKLYGKS